MLVWKSTTVCSNIGIDSLLLLLCKLRKIIPVSLKRICDLMCSLWVAQLQNRVVVECPVLGLLVLPPDLLALDSKDLHSNTAWSGYVIGNELWSQGGVTHDHIVLTGLGEHALCEVWWKIVFDSELAHYALEIYQMGQISSEGKKTYTLSLQMCTAETVVVLVEIHHLEAVELVGNLLDLLGLSWLDDLYTFSVPSCC